MKSTSFWLAWIGQIHAPDSHRHHLCTAGIEGRGIFGIGFVLSRADDQARFQGPARNDKGFVDGRFGRRVAAADKVDDLKPVALADNHGVVLRARHDLQIAFNRDLGRIHPKTGQQIAHA